jgi:hypothetical protein
MNFLDIIGWAVFFYLLWQLLGSWFFVQQLRHRINDAVEEAEILREAEKSVLALKFEHVKENGHQVVLAYGKNNKFLGQGLTEEDAAKNIQLSYPKHRILIVNEKATITKVLDPLDIKSV